MLKNIEDLKIGSQAFLVHKKYVDDKLGGRIRICRLKTFQNVNGEIEPILTEVGNSKLEIDTKTHYLYLELSDAINAIRTKKLTK